MSLFIFRVAVYNLCPLQQQFMVITLRQCFSSWGYFILARNWLKGKSLCLSVRRFYIKLIFQSIMTFMPSSPFCCLKCLFQKANLNKKIPLFINTGHISKDLVVRRNQKNFLTCTYMHGIGLGKKTINVTIGKNSINVVPCTIYL